MDERSRLVIEGMKTLQPDIIALNEVSIVRQTARELKRNIGSVQDIDYNLVQQTRANGLSLVEGEALLTRFAVVETGNLDFQTRDMVAQVARVLVDGRPLDVYVTHLYMSRGDDSLRLFQVQQLLTWIDQTKRCVGLHRLRGFQRDIGHALGRADGEPISSHPERRPRRSRRWLAAMARYPILIGRGWTGALIIFGRLARSRSAASGVCFDKSCPDDPSLWPSDHAGVWADLVF